MTEILFGIRVIKFYAWEPHFAQKVAECRQQELSHLKAIKYWDALCVYTWAALPVVISITTFVTHVLLGNQLTAAKVGVAVCDGTCVCVVLEADEGREETSRALSASSRLCGSSTPPRVPQASVRRLWPWFPSVIFGICRQVFTTLALVGQLIVPLNSFPWVINSILEAKVSLERIQRFFKLANRDPQAYYAQGRRRGRPLGVDLSRTRASSVCSRASRRRPPLRPAEPGFLFLAGPPPRFSSALRGRSF